MFILAFIRWLLGWARFEAEGGFPERLLNLAARGGVSIWDTGRRSVSMTGCCYARKYKKLRPLAKKAGRACMSPSGTACPFSCTVTGRGAASSWVWHPISFCCRFCPRRSGSSRSAATKRCPKRRSWP